MTHPFLLAADASAKERNRPFCGHGTNPTGFQVQVLPILQRASNSQKAFRDELSHLAPPRAPGWSEGFRRASPAAARDPEAAWAPPHPTPRNHEETTKKAPTCGILSWLGVFALCPDRRSWFQALPRLRAGLVVELKVRELHDVLLANETRKTILWAVFQRLQSLLMAEACQKQVLCPKHPRPFGRNCQVPIVNIQNMFFGTCDGLRRQVAKSCG